ncbi:MAG: hypothetical protein A2428_03705 [Bdellovibrionales bacterium RIFOXYC1_FULL_54_43]|nr:MAG: hypothetical protein A2428_03705 [Bdellovibrionales bacterium RIFOXYC1_FULL_54_43]OFZ83817.1 MAG: hypothetical protein A2603_11130 [Bdellovibrionales bacterium RIFOXYD1_FULL_55_31]
MKERRRKAKSASSDQLQELANSVVLEIQLKQAQMDDGSPSPNSDALRAIRRVRDIANELLRQARRRPRR